jgi:uncharacterized membrane protein YedE/YeeE
MLITALIASFMAGYAMKSRGLCTYAAALQIVEQGRTDRLCDFLGASAWATVIVVPFSWWFSQSVILSGWHEHIIVAIFGGLFLGLGAFVNKGCVFGTFVQLVGGNLTYLGTLAGMAIGVVISQVVLIDIIPKITHSSLVNSPGIYSFSWLVFTGLFAIAMLFKSRISEASASFRFIKSWQIKPKLEIFFMLVIGIAGGFLFTTISGWDFATVLTNFTLNRLDAVNPTPNIIAISCTLAMVAGGIYAAITSGRFVFQFSGLFPFMWRLAGGILMGAAARIIPGGNDGMLLKSIPSLAPHAISGFILMIVTMLLLLKYIPNNQNYNAPKN